MNGHVNEELLALYLRGDLPEKDQRNVARHAGDCAECQQTLADLSRSYELLTDSLEDPEQDDLAAVRAAVMLRIRPRTAVSTRWVLGLAATATLMLAILFAWHNERQELPAVARLPRPGPPAVALLAPPVEPPVEPAKMRVARAPHKHIEPGMRAARLLTQAGEPAILKMNTSDPNVVILWQLQEKEKQENEKQENEKVATP
jgi:anti-sigma factor RsiW